MHQESEVDKKIPKGDLTIERQDNTLNANEEKNDEVEEIEAEIDGNVSDTSPEEVLEKANEYLRTMSTEAKISQLLIITPEELTDFSLTVQAGETTKNKLLQYPVCGIIYTDKNFEVPDQMELMLNNTKLYTKYPMFLAIDEAGLVPIHNLNMDTKELGLNVEVLEEKLYFILGDEKREIGTDLNVVFCNEQTDVVESIVNGGDILFIQSGFNKIYDKLVLAVKNNEITEELLNQRILNTLVYKIENGI